MRAIRVRDARLAQVPEGKAISTKTGDNSEKTSDFRCNLWGNPNGALAVDLFGGGNLGTEAERVWPRPDGRENWKHHRWWSLVTKPL